MRYNRKNQVLEDIRERRLERKLASVDEESLGVSFETVSKNLSGYPAAYSYSMGKISSISYTIPGGTITKTFNYTLDKLTSIVLSGDTPDGVSLTKTLGYTINTLTSTTYS